MQPDRFEWLHGEQERQARDPTGLGAIGSCWARYGQWKLGVLLAILPAFGVFALLFDGGRNRYESIGWLVLGTVELAAAFAIWRLVERRTPLLNAAGWTALIFGSFAVLAAIFF
jgi:hypothetical protein